MNYYYLIAGILSLMAVFGHFTMGAKDFLKPVLDSQIDVIPKKVMHSLFHYMSVFMVLTTIIMLMFSFDKRFMFENTHDIGIFIGIIYSGFAISQFVIALISSIDKGIFKLFQWVFWILIAVFCFLGV
ncbi:MAG: hypothetical protein AMJ61_02195 [Desulfobacterales bacterium SG8_35_2]|nr:MAG: hypothetical protein AMJ61_02195 [Desulfobacterales bacterium SG8_35_2]